MISMAISAIELELIQSRMAQTPVLRGEVGREHGSCLMPPTHMFAHHRGGQRQPTPGNIHRSSSHHTTVSHTHRTPTWTWTFIQPKPHTHPADIAREIESLGVWRPHAPPSWTSCLVRGVLSRR